MDLSHINIVRDPEHAKPEVSILECFLYEEIDNNRIPNEDVWSITWVGDDFILLNTKTNELFNFAVTIVPGTLTVKEIKKAADDQEWFYEDEEGYDEDE